jgi:hypothetical protein
MAVDPQFLDIIRESVDAGLRAAAGGVVRPKKWLGKKEACARIGDGISEATMDDWIVQKKGPPSVGRGRHRVWDVDAIDAWLAAGGDAGGAE